MASHDSNSCTSPSKPNLQSSVTQMSFATAIELSLDATMSTRRMEDSMMAPASVRMMGNVSTGDSFGRAPLLRRSVSDYQLVAARHARSLAKLQFDNPLMPEAGSFSGHVPRPYSHAKYFTEDDSLFLSSRDDRLQSASSRLIGLPKEYSRLHIELLGRSGRMSSSTESPFFTNTLSATHSSETCEQQAVPMQPYDHSCTRNSSTQCFRYLRNPGIGPCASSSEGFVSIKPVGGAAMDLAELSCDNAHSNPPTVGLQDGFLETHTDQDSDQQLVLFGLEPSDPQLARTSDSSETYDSATFLSPDNRQILIPAISWDKGMSGPSNPFKTLGMGTIQEDTEGVQPLGQSSSSSPSVSYSATASAHAKTSGSPTLASILRHKGPPSDSGAPAHDQECLSSTRSASSEDLENASVEHPHHEEDAFMTVQPETKEIFIHRDLKLQNFLITAEGYIMLADFGLAKQMTMPVTTCPVSAAHTDSKPWVTPYLTEQSIRDRGAGATCATERKTVVGTINYMCPEVFTCDTVGRSADYWALGCILYEILTGEAVFVGQNPEELAHRLSSIHTVEDYEEAWPERNGLSDNAWSMVTGLLSHPSRRLGRADNYKALLEHPFFTMGHTSEDILGFRAPSLREVLRRRRAGEDIDEELLEEVPVYPDEAFLSLLPAPWRPHLDCSTDLQWFLGDNAIAPSSQSSSSSTTKGSGTLDGLLANASDASGEHAAPGPGISSPGATAADTAATIVAATATRQETEVQYDVPSDFSHLTSTSTLHSDDTSLVSPSFSLHSASVKLLDMYRARTVPAHLDVISGQPGPQTSEAVQNIDLVETARHLQRNLSRSSCAEVYTDQSTSSSDAPVEHVVHFVNARRLRPKNSLLHGHVYSSSMNSLPMSQPMRNLFGSQGRPVLPCADAHCLRQSLQAGAWQSSTPLLEPTSAPVEDSGLYRVSSEPRIPRETIPSSITALVDYVVEDSASDPFLGHALDQRRAQETHNGDKANPLPAPSRFESLSKRRSSHLASSTEFTGLLSDPYTHGSTLNSARTVIRQGTDLSTVVGISGDSSYCWLPDTSGLGNQRLSHSFSVGGKRFSAGSYFFDQFSSQYSRTSVDLQTINEDGVGIAPLQRQLPSMTRSMYDLSRMGPSLAQRAAHLHDPLSDRSLEKGKSHSNTTYELTPSSTTPSNPGLYGSASFLETSHHLTPVQTLQHSATYAQCSVTPDARRDRQSRLWHPSSQTVSSSKLRQYNQIFSKTSTFPAGKDGTIQTPMTRRSEVYQATDASFSPTERDTVYVPGANEHIIADGSAERGLLTSGHTPVLSPSGCTPTVVATRVLSFGSLLDHAFIRTVSSVSVHARKHPCIARASMSNSICRSKSSLTRLSSTHTPGHTRHSRDLAEYRLSLPVQVLWRGDHAFRSRRNLMAELSSKTTPDVQDTIFADQDSSYFSCTPFSEQTALPSDTTSSTLLWRQMVAASQARPGLMRGLRGTIHRNLSSSLSTAGTNAPSDDVNHSDPISVAGWSEDHPFSFDSYFYGVHHHKILVHRVKHNVSGGSHERVSSASDLAWQNRLKHSFQDSSLLSRAAWLREDREAHPLIAQQVQDLHNVMSSSASSLNASPIVITTTATALQLHPKLISPVDLYEDTPQTNLTRLTHLPLATAVSDTTHKQDSSSPYGPCSDSPSSISTHVTSLADRAYSFTARSFPYTSKTSFSSSQATQPDQSPRRQGILSHRLREQRQEASLREAHSCPCLLHMQLSRRSALEGSQYMRRATTNGFKPAASTTFFRVRTGNKQLSDTRSSQSRISANKSALGSVTYIAPCDQAGSNGCDLVPSPGYIFHDLQRIATSGDGAGRRATTAGQGVLYKDVHDLVTRRTSVLTTAETSANSTPTVCTPSVCRSNRRLTDSVAPDRRRRSKDLRRRIAQTSIHEQIDFSHEIQQELIDRVHAILRLDRYPKASLDSQNDTLDLAGAEQAEALCDYRARFIEDEAGRAVQLNTPFRVSHASRRETSPNFLRMPSQHQGEFFKSRRQSMFVGPRASTLTMRSNELSTTSEDRRRNILGAADAHNPSSRNASRDDLFSDRPPRSASFKKQTSSSITSLGDALPDGSIRLKLQRPPATHEAPHSKSFTSAYRRISSLASMTWDAHDDDTKGAHSENPCISPMDGSPRQSGQLDRLGQCDAHAHAHAHVLKPSPDTQRSDLFTDSLNIHIPPTNEVHSPSETSDQGDAHGQPEDVLRPAFMRHLERSCDRTSLCRSSKSIMLATKLTRALRERQRHCRTTSLYGKPSASSYAPSRMTSLSERDGHQPASMRHNISELVGLDLRRLNDYTSQSLRSNESNLKSPDRMDDCAASMSNASIMLADGGQALPARSPGRRDLTLMDKLLVFSCHSKDNLSTAAVGETIDMLDNFIPYAPKHSFGTLTRSFSDYLLGRRRSSAHSSPFASAHTRLAMQALDLQRRFAEHMALQRTASYGALFNTAPRASGRPPHAGVHEPLRRALPGPEDMDSSVLTDERPDTHLGAFNTISSGRVPAGPEKSVRDAGRGVAASKSEEIFSCLQKTSDDFTNVSMPLGASKLQRVNNARAAHDGFTLPHSRRPSSLLSIPAYFDGSAEFYSESFMRPFVFSPIQSGSGASRAMLGHPGMERQLSRPSHVEAADASSAYCLVKVNPFLPSLSRSAEVKRPAKSRTSSTSYYRDSVDKACDAYLEDLFSVQSSRRVQSRKCSMGLRLFSSMESDGDAESLTVIPETDLEHMAAPGVATHNRFLSKSYDCLVLDSSDVSSRDMPLNNKVTRSRSASMLLTSHQAPLPTAYCQTPEQAIPMLSLASDSLPAEYTAEIPCRNTAWAGTTKRLRGRRNSINNHGAHMIVHQYRGSGSWWPSDEHSSPRRPDRALTLRRHSVSRRSHSFNGIEHPLTVNYATAKSVHVFTKTSPRKLERFVSLHLRNYIRQLLKEVPRGFYSSAYPPVMLMLGSVRYDLHIAFDPDTQSFNVSMQNLSSTIFDRNIFLSSLTHDESDAGSRIEHPGPAAKGARSRLSVHQSFSNISSHSNIFSCAACMESTSCEDSDSRLGIATALHRPHHPVPDKVCSDADAIPPIVEINTSSVQTSLRSDPLQCTQHGHSRMHAGAEASCSDNMGHQPHLDSLAELKKGSSITTNGSIRTRKQHKIQIMKAHQGRSRNKLSAVVSDEGLQRPRDAECGAVENGQLVPHLPLGHGAIAEPHVSYANHSRVNSRSQPSEGPGALCEFSSHSGSSNNFVIMSRTGTDSSSSGALLAAAENNGSSTRLRQMYVQGAGQAAYEAPLASLNRNSSDFAGQMFGGAKERPLGFANSRASTDVSVSFLNNNLPFTSARASAGCSHDGELVTAAMPTSARPYKTMDGNCLFRSLLRKLSDVSTSKNGSRNVLPSEGPLYGGGSNSCIQPCTPVVGDTGESRHLRDVALSSSCSTPIYHNAGWSRGQEAQQEEDAAPQDQSSPTLGHRPISKDTSIVSKSGSDNVRMQDKQSRLSKILYTYEPDDHELSLDSVSQSRGQRYEDRPSLDTCRILQDLSCTADAGSFSARSRLQAPARPQQQPGIAAPRHAHTHMPAPASAPAVPDTLMGRKGSQRSILDVLQTPSTGTPQATSRKGLHDSSSTKDMSDYVVHTPASVGKRPMSLTQEELELFEDEPAMASTLAPTRSPGKFKQTALRMNLGNTSRASLVSNASNASLKSPVMRPQTARMSDSAAGGHRFPGNPLGLDISRYIQDKAPGSVLERLPATSRTANSICNDSKFAGFDFTNRIDIDKPTEQAMIQLRKSLNAKRTQQGAPSHADSGEAWTPITRNASAAHGMEDLSRTTNDTQRRGPLRNRRSSLSILVEKGSQPQGVPGVGVGPGDGK